MANLGHERIEFPDEYRWNNQKMAAWPEYFFIQYTVSGTGMFITDSKTSRITEGKAFLCSRDHDFAYYYDQKVSDHWEFKWLGFCGLSGQIIFKTIQREFGKVVALPPGSRAVDMMQEALHLSQKSAWRDVTHMSLFATEFLICLMDELKEMQRKSIEPRLGSAIDYIKANFAEKININTISSRFGYTREHFTRMFTKKHGQSPSQYLQDLRVEKAKELLRMTHLPLEMVSRLSGFSDVNYLCRVFRQRTGITPLDFRKANINSAGGS